MKYPQTIYFLIILALVIVICFRECGDPVVKKSLTTDSVKSLKDSINILKAKKQVVVDRIVIKEVDRIKYLTKYKVSRHDSLIPCEDKLIICDTLVLADSSLISELKVQAMVDSMLIRNLDKVVQMDSVQIAGLNKEVKKQKRLKWVFFIGGAATSLIRQ